MDFSDKNTVVGCHFLLQGNLSDPGFEPTSPALQVDSLPLNHLGSPKLAPRFVLKTEPGLQAAAFKIGKQASFLGRTGDPGGLPSMGSHRVGHDRSDLAAAADQVVRAFGKASA